MCIINVIIKHNVNKINLKCMSVRVLCKLVDIFSVNSLSS